VKGESQLPVASCAPASPAVAGRKWQIVSWQLTTDNAPALLARNLA